MQGIFKSYCLLGLAAFVFGTLVGDAGTLKGRIVSDKRIVRKVPQRYPGHHGQKAKKTADMPAIIMLIGPVKGHPPPKPRSDVKIVQKSFEFHPKLTVVPINSKVDFPNMDSEFHNVFSYSKIKRFDLGRYHKGESKSVRFNKAGVGKIYCEIHEWMRAAIVVVENPFYAVADKAGNYIIRDIPEGSYHFLVWKIDHKKLVRKLDISKEGILEQDFALPEKKKRRSAGSRRS